jgi:basic membrane protein A
VGRLNDKSFNETSWNGVKMAEAQLGAEVNFIETQSPNDYAKNIDQFATQGYNVIVTVGFLLGEATTVAAKKYPNIKFIGVDQFQAESIPNLAGLIFDEDKAGYLAGAMAALLTKSNKVGSVLATDTVPPVWRFGEGFRVGALATKPGLEVSQVYHNDVGPEKTFVDPEWGKQQANSMLDKGVDIVFGAGGSTGNGALEAVAERVDTGAMAIGVDTDQFNTVPAAQPVLVSSAMKRLDDGVFTLLKQISESSFKGGNFTGKVGLAPFHNFEEQVPADVKTRLQELEQQLLDGTLKTGVPPVKPTGI